MAVWVLTRVVFHCFGGAFDAVFAFAFGCGTAIYLGLFVRTASAGFAFGFSLGTAIYLGLFARTASLCLFTRTACARFASGFRFGTATDFGGLARRVGGTGCCATGHRQGA